MQALHRRTTLAFLVYVRSIPLQDTEPVSPASVNSLVFKTMI